MTSDSVARRLSAIFYADVVGYSRLTEQDEVGTHHKLVAFLDDVSASIERYGGTVVKYVGDAILAEFQSAVAALDCAAAIQRDHRPGLDGGSEEEQLTLRIGLNVGDVIVARDDIYGEGVNIAARLESLAPPGGICLSHAVYEQVRNKTDLSFDDLGEQKVKNIDEPVRAYTVALDPGTVARPFAAKRPVFRSIPVLATVSVLVVAVGMAAYWLFRDQAGPDKGAAASPAGAVLQKFSKPSIVVLPFKNLSDDSEQDYLSIGITEDLTTDLSKFGNLVVIANNTASTFKDKPASDHEVSKRLGVRYILRGSIRRNDSQVRITVQLIEGGSGRHIWANRFKREAKGLLAVQDEIVTTIVRTLAIKVGAAERERVMRKPTKDMKAYDYLLRGRVFLSKATLPANEKARSLFREAIKSDPNFALAHVALGQSYLDSLRYGWSASPSRALQRVHDLAQKALTLDAQSAAAHRLLGFAFLKWRKFDLAAQEFEKALALNPNDADSHDALGGVWLYAGKTEAAIKAVETAKRYNPNLPASGFIHLGLAYYLKGRYADAIKTMETVSGRNPNLVVVHVVLAASYAEAGRAKDAKRAAATVRRLHPFFKVEYFGNAFRKPSDRQRILQGLAKAGLR